MSSLVKHLRQLRRVSMLALVVLVASLFLMSSPSKQAEAASYPANVSAVVLFVNCPSAAANAVSVDYYYFHLDGAEGHHYGDFSTGNLTYNSGATAIQFYNLNINYDADSAFYLNLSDGSYIEWYIYGGTWNINRSNGNIYKGAYC